jgi:hypothetical protein
MEGLSSPSATKHNNAQAGPGVPSLKRGDTRARRGGSLEARHPRTHYGCGLNLRTPHQQLGNRGMHEDMSGRLKTSETNRGEMDGRHSTSRAHAEMRDSALAFNGITTLCMTRSDASMRRTLGSSCRVVACPICRSGVVPMARLTVRGETPRGGGNLKPRRVR